VPEVSRDPDDLIPFLELVASNQKANIARFPEPYEIIRRINICFSTAGRNLVNPKPATVGILFLRCQYAYKTAAGMALSGQVCEAFVMMRSCLEYAGYGLIIFREPELERVFSSRHAASEDLRSHRKAFNPGAIKRVLDLSDSDLSNLFEKFYQRTIDFGAHPNPHATFSAMEMHADNSFTALAMVTETDHQVLLHAFKSVAQVGLTALFIFQHVFKAKFELLSLRAEMERLRHSGL
jgi:hypothetical protein